MAQALPACWHIHRHNCDIRLDSGSSAGSTHPEDVPELEDEPEPLLLEPEPELLDEGDACLSRAMAAANTPTRRQAAQLPGLQSPADASTQLLLQPAKAARSLLCLAMQAKRVDSACDTFPVLPMGHCCLQKLIRASHRSTAGNLSAHLRPAACDDEL